MFGETSCAERRNAQFSESRFENERTTAKRNVQTAVVRAALSGATFVAMMQSTDLRDRHNLTGIRRLDRSSVRRILFEAQVSAAPMVILGERNQMSAKAALVEHDDVVEAFAANGTDQTFYISTLPGCIGCAQYLLDAHRRQLLHKLLSENAIAIAQHKARCRLPGKRLRLAGVQPIRPSDAA